MFVHLDSFHASSAVAVCYDIPTHTEFADSVSANNCSGNVLMPEAQPTDVAHRGDICRDPKSKLTFVGLIGPDFDSA